MEMHLKRVQFIVRELERLGAQEIKTSDTPSGTAFEAVIPLRDSELSQFFIHVSFTGAAKIKCKLNNVDINTVKTKELMPLINKANENSDLLGFYVDVERTLWAKSIIFLGPVERGNGGNRVASAVKRMCKELLDFMPSFRADIGIIELTDKFDELFGPVSQKQEEDDDMLAMMLKRLTADED